MTSKPTLWNRMVAVLNGEIPADTLEAYRRASLAVYDQLDHAEQHRLTCKTEGKNPWTVAPATQAELLCAWNAFVLQNLGDQFLEADYVGNPQTVGYVLPITGDQILGFYTQVEGWLNRAQQAHYNPDYKLDVYVPAELPAWSEVEPCPNAHLRGMLEAMHSIRDHAGAAMHFLSETTPPTDETQLKQMRFIQQLYASATSKARYADDLHGADPTREVHERVEPHVKEAIEKFYAVGQLLAMPTLATDYQRLNGQATGQPTGQPARPQSHPQAGFATPVVNPILPNQTGFDLWCLTDPATLARWQADPEARKAIKLLWQLDPNPGETLRIKAEIDAAFQRGDLRWATDRYGKRLGHFFCCPWGPVYEAIRTVHIGGTRITTMQQFIYNVTCEGVNLGAPFTREIMVGTFNPTTRFEYGDPDEAPDH
jgi:hypothetical protein